MKKRMSLNERMAVWLQQASSASGYLGRLYLDLKDPLQRERAVEAGAFAREHSRTKRSPVSRSIPPWIGKSSSEGEHIAWLALIEGLLGPTMLVTLGAEGASFAWSAKGSSMRP